MEKSPQQILAQQLAMNERTWTQLEAHGVNSKTLLRLDFMFLAAVESEAESLKRFLSEETDYAVEVISSPKGVLLKGQTQPTAVNKEILDQWVTWMVQAGLKHNCVFDGWGTEVP